MKGEIGCIELAEEKKKKSSVISVEVCEGAIGGLCLIYCVCL